MPEQRQTPAASHGITVLGALAVGPAVVAACVIVTIKIGVSLGVGLVPSAWASIATVIVLLVAAFASGAGRHLLLRRPSLSETLMFLGLLGLLVVLWDRAADRSLVWPHLYGVDQAHHGSLVTWIVDERRLPTADPRIGSLGNYPIGVHLIAAMTTLAMGTTPITAMWWTALGIIIVQVFAIVWLVRVCSPKRSLTGAPIALAVWLAAWQFGVGSLSASFFFSQALGVTFCLVGVGLVVLGSSGTPRRQWLPAAVVLTAATAWTYPQHASTIPACVGVVLALQAHQWFKVLQPTKRKIVGIPLVLTVGAAVALAWRASRNSPYLTRGAFFGNGEGALPALSVGNIGGVLIAALMALAVVELAVGARRRRTPPVLLIAISSAVGLGALLAVGRALGWGVTQYRITKNAYLAMPLLAVGVGVLLAISGQSLVIACARRSADSTDRMRWLRRIEFGGVSVGLAVVAVVALSRGPLRLASEPVMDRDSYRLARVAAKKYNPEDIGVAGEGLGPYAIWWTGLRRNAPVGTAIVAPRMEVWRDWPEGARPERYLIVDSTVYNDFASRTGVRVVGRFGTAALLERENPVPKS